MSNRIFGVIGILWGSLILISQIAKGGPQGGGAYALGGWIALAFAALLIYAGISALKTKKPTGK